MQPFVVSIVGSIVIVIVTIIVLHGATSPLLEFIHLGLLIVSACLIRLARHRLV